MREGRSMTTWYRTALGSVAVVLVGTVALAAPQPLTTPPYTAHLPVVLDPGTAPPPATAHPTVVSTSTPIPTMTPTSPPLPSDTVIIRGGMLVRRTGYTNGVFVGELINTTSGAVQIDEVYGEFRFWNAPVVREQGYARIWYLGPGQRTPFWIENPYYDHATHEIHVRWQPSKQEPITGLEVVDSGDRPGTPPATAHELYGVLHNTTDQAMQFVRVAVIVRNAEGSVVQEGAVDLHDRLEPGHTIAFAIPIDPWVDAQYTFHTYGSPIP